MRHDIAGHRKEYEAGGLLEAASPGNPGVLFRDWFAAAEAAGVPEPTGMVLSTASPDGRPSARVVLLKGFGADGFRFFTNYESRKGRELAANPFGALTFWWPQLERQVRVEGEVQRLPEEVSDAYFQSRPLGSRIGAWVSPQSRVLADRDELEQALEEATGRHADAPPPRPPFWGGFLLRPTLFEFWQGRASRLHDRLVYTADETGWIRSRLAP